MLRIDFQLQIFMRKSILLIFLFFSIADLFAQQLYPVRINKKWGLINGEGKLTLAAKYDGIGDFKSFGYAVMQRNGGVGLLDKTGREIVSPKYKDIKVLDSLLVAVMENGEWMVLNMKGKVILNKGYTRLKLWGHKYLSFLKDDQWGIVDMKGKEIALPEYDEISYEEGRFFLTIKDEKIGLLAQNGAIILPNIADEIKVFNDDFFFFRKDKRWGGVNAKGRIVLEPKYDAWKALSPEFVKLVKNAKLSLYSVKNTRIISTSKYDDYYGFSKKHVIIKKDRRLGLINDIGQLILFPRYSEIQAYDRDLFRVNYEGAWGIVKLHDEPIIPFAYEYISPLKNGLCVVKRKGLFGIANKKGEEIVSPEFQSIELEQNRAKAYTEKGGKKELRLFFFDNDGALKDSDEFNNHFQIQIKGKEERLVQKEGPTYYQLDNFEWFYSPQEDSWGLRRVSDGNIQIEPTFQYVQVEAATGFTLVGMWKYSKYEFERTSYRFEMVFGLVNNEEGLLVTEMDFLHFNLEDFKKGQPLARFISASGRHGLINEIGKVIRRDFAYIGEFQDGRARVSISGRLSGSMKPSHSLGRLSEYLNGIDAPSSMLDYTKFDLLFKQNASLICEDCEWGYLDTLGSIVIAPQYTFVQNFINETGIVECGGKWGMVNAYGQKVIPCNYDGINYLENTDNKIVRVYLKAPKYGLIDTLGELRVSTIYDEIGAFAEDRLAVKRNGLWGYVNKNGLEVIPCRFRAVREFNEGLAAVKIGRYWGYIDKNGEATIGFKFKYCGNFSEGLTWVDSGDGEYYIDASEQTIIEKKFEKTFDFKHGVARVVLKGKYGLIDKKGDFVLRAKYGKVNEFNEHGLAVIRYGRDKIRYGVINTKGIKITRSDFLKIEEYNEGLAVVKDKNGFGFIDVTGKLVIPCQYSRAADFKEGLAAVTKKGNCGYIQKDGKTGIDYAFSRCQDFEDGRAVIYKGIHKAGLIDVYGNYIIKPSLDRLLRFKDGRGLVRDKKYRFYYITEQASLYNGYYQKARAYEHGVAVVMANGKWGIINQKGLTLTPPKYDKIEQFVGGYAKVMIAGYNGLTNLKGELIAKPSYELISYAGEGLFRAEQGDKVGYLDAAGKWVWELRK